MNKFVLKVFVFMILISIQSYAQNTFEVNFTTPEDDFVNRSLIDDEGNILLVGSIGSGQNNLTMSALIIKVSPDGSYQWRNLNRTDTVSRFSTITVLDNGNYFVTGAYSVGGDFYSMDRFWVMIFDQNLEVVTEKSYGINEPYVKYGGMNLSLINQR